jgi:hypothetical protein
MYLSVESFPLPKNPHILIQYINFIKSINNTISKNEYYEKHHIIPKSMGGSNSQNNLIRLTASQHYQAHKLLWLAYDNLEMTVAFWRMSHDKKHNPVTEHEYAILKENMSKFLSVLNKEITTEWHKTRDITLEKQRRLKISETLKNRHALFTDEEKQLFRLRFKNNKNAGKPKAKVVCRISDRKEMPIAHFTQWIKRQEK